MKQYGKYNDTKICNACGSTYSRADNYSPATWARRRFCSMSCGHSMAARPYRTLAWAFDHYAIPEPMSGCWLWSGTLGPIHGYGQIRIANVLWCAHRLSYTVHYGEIPPGLMVLHRCDTRPCVNPDHLYLGTAKDNVRDALVRNRMPVGEQNYRAVLTNGAVRHIRATTESNSDLAMVYGVTRQAIRNARAGKTWRSV